MLQKYLYLKSKKNMYNYLINIDKLYAIKVRKRDSQTNKRKKRRIEQSTRHIRQQNAK